MTELTVIPLDDLEALLFATGAMKTIEEILTRNHKDPFVPPETKITDAHNRLMALVRSTKRSNETYATPWDGKLEQDEIVWLRLLDHHNIPYITIAVEERSPVVDRLAAKGCIDIGSAVIGVIWPGASRAELKPDPTRYVIRMTQRGQNKLHELDKR